MESEQLDRTSATNAIFDEDAWREKCEAIQNEAWNRASQSIWLYNLGVNDLVDRELDGLAPAHRQRAAEIAARQYDYLPKVEDDVRTTWDPASRHCPHGILTGPGHCPRCDADWDWND